MKYLIALALGIIMFTASTISSKLIVKRVRKIYEKLDVKYKRGTIDETSEEYWIKTHTAENKYTRLNRISRIFFLSAFVVLSILVFIPASIYGIKPTLMEAFWNAGFLGSLISIPAILGIPVFLYVMDLLNIQLLLTDRCYNLKHVYKHYNEEQDRLATDNDIYYSSHEPYRGIHAKLYKYSPPV